MPASGASSPFSHPSYSFSTSTRISHPPSWTSTPASSQAHPRQQQPSGARPIDHHSGHAGSRPRHNKGHRSSVLLNPPQIGDRASSLYSAHFAASTASLACSPDPPRPAFYSHTNYTAFELSSNRRFSTINSGGAYDPAAGSEWCTAQHRVAFAPPPTSSSSSSVSSGQATPGRKSFRSKWDALLRAAHIGGGRKKSTSGKGSKPGSGFLTSKSVYDLPSSAPLELYSNPQPYYVHTGHEAFLSTAYSSGNSSRMSLSVSAASSSRPGGQILFESVSQSFPCSRFQFRTNTPLFGVHSAEARCGVVLAAPEGLNVAFSHVVASACPLPRRFGAIFYMSSLTRLAARTA